MAQRKLSLLDLPAEIRNHIYDLSGCLRVVQCENCKKHATEDVTTLGHERTCSGNPRIQWPIRYPRHFACRFSRNENIIELARYQSDYVVTHEYVNIRTQVLAMPQPYECRSPEQPALTRVCRLIRNDTLPMFYGGNKFALSPRVAKGAGVGWIATEDFQWLQAIGEGNASFISKMELRFSGRGWRALLLENVKESLREMGIDMDRVEVEFSYWKEARWSSDCSRTALRAAGN